MNRKQLIVARMFGLVIMLFVSGCATQDEAKKDNSGNARVSGDLTVSSVDRKGF